MMKRTVRAVGTFLKVTIAGGLLFLIPAVLTLVLLRHAMAFAEKFTAPIAARLPDDLAGAVAIATLLAALVLLGIAFMAGLLARTWVGRRITAGFEDSLFGSLPQYRMIKSMAEGLAHIEAGKGMHPVLLRGDSGWQLGYRIEELPGGWVVVFLPAAPTPTSGNVVYVRRDRVRALDVSMADAIKLVKSIGVGSAEVLRGVDFGPGEGAHTLAPRRSGDD